MAKLIVGIALLSAAVVLWGCVCLWRMVAEMADTEREVEEEWDLLDGDCGVMD